MYIYYKNQPCPYRMSRWLFMPLQNTFKTFKSECIDTWSSEKHKRCERESWLSQKHSPHATFEGDFYRSQLIISAQGEWNGMDWWWVVAGGKREGKRERKPLQYSAPLLRDCRLSWTHTCLQVPLKGGAISWLDFLLTRTRHHRGKAKEGREGEEQQSLSSV